MGRPKRIQFPGACYLVQLQGNNRQDLFLSNQDRRQFLALLKAHKQRFGLKVYAYSLLDAEASLLLETPAPNLAVVMQSFNTQYTKYFNSAHNTVGHVLQGRYKAYVVDKESHLAEATRHVHLACVRAALKDRPWRYQWSSCAAYVEAEHKEPLVDSRAILRPLGPTRLQQAVRYLSSLKESLKSGGELPVAGGVAVGSEAFLAALRARSGGPAPAAPAAEEAARRILSETASRRGVEESKILSRLQWREISAARREAVHRAWKEARLGVSQLARLFGRTPSAISQIIRAMEGGGRGGYTA